MGDWRRKLDKTLAQRRHAKKKIEEEREALRVLESKLSSIEEAQRIAQRVAQQVQNHVHSKIAAVVSQCLSIFDEPYEFKITFERKRSRTEARLSFERDDSEVDPLSASGGGVVDVAAFALRLACLLLSQPPLRRLVVLDEPFKHLSPEYRPRARVLLEKLSSDLDVQIVLVTHSRALRSGSVIPLE